jgi:hypothetical protein
MKVTDCKGRELAVGDRVRTRTNEESLAHFDPPRRGSVADFKAGPPVVAVRFDNDRPGRGPFWFSVSTNWRTDLELIDSGN